MFKVILRDARSGVAKLVEAGYEFYVITSFSSLIQYKSTTTKNLDNVFGEGVFTKLVCLDTGADKDDALKWFKDTGLYWLEDKTTNANRSKIRLKSI